MWFSVYFPSAVGLYERAFHSKVVTKWLNTVVINRSSAWYKCKCMSVCADTGSIEGVVMNFGGPRELSEGKGKQELKPIMRGKGHPDRGHSTCPGVKTGNCGWQPELNVAHYYWILDLELGRKRETIRNQVAEGLLRHLDLIFGLWGFRFVSSCSVMGQCLQAPLGYSIGADGRVKSVLERPVRLRPESWPELNWPWSRGWSRGCGFKNC